MIHQLNIILTTTLTLILAFVSSLFTLSAQTVNTTHMMVARYMKQDVANDAISNTISML